MKKQKKPDKVQIIHVLVEDKKKRTGERDGGGKKKQGVTSWIPQRENEKQQVRKKKKNDEVEVEGVGGGRGSSRRHERQMLRLAVEFSRTWRDLMVKSSRPNLRQLLSEVPLNTLYVQEKQ